MPEEYPVMPERETQSLHVLHVVSGLSPAGGGPSVSVPGLCAGLVSAGCRVALATLGPGLSEDALAAQEKGVELQVMRPTRSGPLGYSRELSRRLPDLAEAADLIHVHQLWQYPGWAAGAAARRLGKPLVISPRGSLEPWRLTRSRWKKRLAAALFDDANLRAAACMHATAASESEGFRAYGLTNPVTVIPNGVDVEALAVRPGDVPYYEQRPECRGKRNALFLSRIHPTKGLLELLGAWQALAGAHSDWHLTIAGPDSVGHLPEVLRRAEELGLSGSVTCVGPLYGREKAVALREADLVVLPTYSENFGIVVIEALAAGVPVLTTHGAPWEGLVTHGCGWWVPVGTAGVREGLAEALACAPEVLQAMGGRGQVWARAAFSWEAIAADMLATYHWLVGRGPRPACVQVAGAGKP